MDDNCTTAEEQSDALVEMLVKGHKAGHSDINRLVSIATDNEATPHRAAIRTLEKLTALGYDVSHVIIETCIGHSFNLVWEHVVKYLPLADDLLTSLHNVRKRAKSTKEINERDELTRVSATSRLTTDLYRISFFVLVSCSL